MKKGKLIISVLILAIGCVPLCADSEKDYYEWITGEMPASFSYTPEENAYLSADTSGYFSGQASMKVGTLRLDGWNTITDKSHVQDNYDPTKNTPCIYHCYQATGSDGKGDMGDPNYLPNTESFTYTKNGKKKSITLKLVTISHLTGGGTIRNNINSFDWPGYDEAKNFAYFKGNNDKFKMQTGDTVDFYLVSVEAYDRDLQLYGNNTLKIDLTGTGKDTLGFRDPLRLSYRIHINLTQASAGNGRGRYVTNMSGLSIFSPSILSDGIHYNHQPLTPDPDVFWSIAFDQNAVTVSPSTDAAQTLVTATLTRSSGSNDIAYAVSYSFDDGKSDERFLMTKNGGTETIPFDLTFTPHGNASIEKGVKYNWFVGSAPTSIAYLKVLNMATGSMDKEAGTYQDTITVTVTALDGGTVTESN